MVTVPLAGCPGWEVYYVHCLPLIIESKPLRTWSTDKFSFLTQIWNYKNMSTVKSPNRKGQKKQTIVDLIAVKINVLVPLLTYSNEYSQALTTCISSTHRELQTIKQSHVSLSSRGSAQQLQEQQSCKIRLQVHTFTSWLVKTSTSTTQATRVETSQSMLGAGIPPPDFQKS